MWERTFEVVWHHYLVWFASNPQLGDTVTAKSAFEARQICAQRWGREITELCAREL